MRVLKEALCVHFARVSSSAESSPKCQENKQTARELVFYLQQRLSNRISSRIIRYPKMIHGQFQAAFKLYAKMHAENMDMASDASHINVIVPRFLILKHLHANTR